MNSNLYVCLNSFRFHNFNFILFTIVLVYNAILFVYISVLKASIQWKSTEKWVLQISKKTTFNYQDFIPTYLRLGVGGQGQRGLVGAGEGIEREGVGWLPASPHCTVYCRNATTRAANHCFGGKWKRRKRVNSRSIHNNC